ncbi:rhombosortase [Mangrovimicrobium sediminis]|uniref:Rhombosortase n=1 Tax=Mangrovimicrobium sediminis TaxID=2562682 RepID=A0A4Z0M243_9GAMM|nr:rhombosortase [Haliea sp. SAOS-164]TGD73497.1 rhombosortase [Haliea sp. SAOS-164]
MRQLPLLTLALAALSGLAALLPGEWIAAGYFDRSALAAGSPIGLVTGHWLHADFAHLGWNLLAFTVLGAIIEAHSRRLLLLSLLAGTLVVDLLLLSHWCDLQRYCGLSGVLNSLLAVALFLRWRETRAAWLPLLAVACALKIVIEMNSGHSLLTHISWPPYAPAHLAGALGGLAVIGSLLRNSDKRSGDCPGGWRTTL